MNATTNATFLRVLAVFLLFSTAAESFGQRKGVRTSPKRESPPAEQKAKEPDYSDKAFNPEEALPSGFRGHNLIEIYQRLAARGKAGVKGEFETTEAYRQRIQADADKPFFGGLTDKSILAFVISKAESNYDADQQTLHVKANLSRLREGRWQLNVKSLNDSRMVLTWDIVGRDKSSYIGTNAYGAQVKVDRIVGDYYEIALDNYQQFPVVRWYPSETYRQLGEQEQKIRERSEKAGVKPPVFEDRRDAAITADLRMDTQTAIKAKRDLQLLLVCRLATPYTIEGSTYYAPTFDSPQEQLLKNYSLNTQLLEIWFFDSGTGQVYLKLRAQKQS